MASRAPTLLLLLACARASCYTGAARAPPLVTRDRSRATVSMWAGESRAGKLFSMANIPKGMSPVAFGLGAAVLIVSNFGVAAFVAAERLAPGSMPPINAFTDIANVAMERAVASGEIPKAMATFWSQRFWVDLISEYNAAGVPAQDFVQQWCSADNDRYEICMAAKQAAQARASSP